MALNLTSDIIEMKATLTNSEILRLKITAVQPQTHTTAELEPSWFEMQISQNVKVQCLRTEISTPSRVCIQYHEELD